MTFALGFALSRSEQLLQHLLHSLGIPLHTQNNATIQLQTGRRGVGITDIEVSTDGILLVIEAKRGSELPAQSQLARYASLCRNPAGRAILLTITNATPEYAKHIISSVAVPAVDIVHFSWRQIRRLAQTGHAAATAITEKHTLSDLITYLGGILGAENIYSNLVYVVSLGGGNPPRWTISWIDIVEKEQRYFYATSGGGWPSPPNYIGFRYDGRLQRIYHVKQWEIVPDLRVVFKQPNGPDWGPRYLLHLDSPIVIERVVKTGPRVRISNRVWCMIDTLLTCDTISEALSATEARIRQAENI